MGVPTTKQEEWRDTNMAEVAKTAFLPADVVSDGSADELAAIHIREGGGGGSGVP